MSDELHRELGLFSLKQAHGQRTKNPCSKPDRRPAELGVVLQLD